MYTLKNRPATSQSILNCTVYQIGLQIFWKSQSHDKKTIFNAGDKVGIVGSTGKSDGPHLHLEIKKTESTKKYPEYANEKEQEYNQANFKNLNKFFANKENDKDWYKIYTAETSTQAKSHLANKLVSNPEGNDYEPKN